MFRTIALFLLWIPAITIAETDVYVQVLGIAQDAGYPQTNCYQPHCMRAWEDKDLRRIPSIRLGHYTGLMHIGREAAGAKGIPVYAMPIMAEYLSNNGPWEQLVRLNNIELMPLTNGTPEGGIHSGYR